MRITLPGLYPPPPHTHTYIYIYIYIYQTIDLSQFTQVSPYGLDSLYLVCLSLVAPSTSYFINYCIFIVWLFLPHCTSFTLFCVKNIPFPFYSLPLLLFSCINNLYSLSWFCFIVFQFFAYLFWSIHASMWSFLWYHIVSPCGINLFIIQK